MLPLPQRSNEVVLPATPAGRLTGFLEVQGVIPPQSYCREPIGIVLLDTPHD